MKVRVDTNVFIASMRYVDLKRKLVWKLLEGDHVVVVTDFILEELRENFACQEASICVISSQRRRGRATSIARRRPAVVMRGKEWQRE